MNEELYEELKELAKECDVPTGAYKEIVACVLAYRDRSDEMLSDESVAEIVRESIQNYDQTGITYITGGLEKEKFRRKSIEQLVEHSIKNIYGYEAVGRHR